MRIRLFLLQDTTQLNQKTLPPCLEDDIIVGGSLKSPGVHAGGQENEG